MHQDIKCGYKEHLRVTWRTDLQLAVLDGSQRQDHGNNEARLRQEGVKDADQLAAINTNMKLTGDSPFVERRNSALFTRGHHFIALIFSSISRLLR